MAGLKAGRQMPYCELCISKTCVWTRKEKYRVREQSLEFIYHDNIV